MKKPVVPNHKLRYARLIPLFALTALLLGGPTFAHAQVGTVWAWGANWVHQLGDGTDIDRNVPIVVGVGRGLTDIVQVSAGVYHSLALKSDGTVLAWGYNRHGQLGDGTKDENGPNQVLGLANAVQVATGMEHSLALLADGTVWAWGADYYGQCGTGDITSIKKHPVQVVGLSGVVQVAGRDGNSYALKSDGTVWAWGYNKYGEIGDGSVGANKSIPAQVYGLTNVVQLVASFALKSDGTLWGWGWNAGGELGDGTNTKYRKRPVQLKGLANVIQVSGGGAHSLAVKSDGTVWAWGNNGSGQLGDGTTTQRTSPVQVSGLTGVVQVSGGGSHSLAVKSDGTVWAWGHGFFGQLGGGTNGNGTDKSTPVQVSDLTGQTYISAGVYFSFSLQAAVLNTGVSASDITVAAGKPTPLTATLKDASRGVLLTNKPLTFSIDGSVVGVAYTNASGVASLSLPRLPLLGVGTHTLSIAFAGSRLYNASNGAATLTITPADTAIKTSTFAGRPGDTRGLYATLKRKTDNASLGNQPLTFKVDGDMIGVATTDGTGKATLPYKLEETYSVGSHTLTIEYAGDNNHNASIGTGTLNVVQAPSGILGSSVSGRAGATVTLKGKLTRKTDGALLIGRTMRFQIDGVEVGSTVTDGINLTTLAYTIPANLSTGAHIITLLFEGDALYLSASDSSKNLTVK